MYILPSDIKVTASICMQECVNVYTKEIMDTATISFKIFYNDVCMKTRFSRLYLEDEHDEYIIYTSNEEDTLEVVQILFEKLGFKVKIVDTTLKNIRMSKEEFKRFYALLKIYREFSFEW